MNASFVFAALAISLLACGEDPSNPPREGPVTIEAHDAHLRYVGRVDRRGGAVRMAWPATSVSFRVAGAHRVRLRARDVPLPDSTPATDYIGVSIDGGAFRPIALREGEATYTIAERLDASEHTIVVAKRTEAEVGTLALLDFTIDAGRFLDPPSVPPLRIEAIGDSVTAGFGLEGRGPDCSFRAAEEDALSTYAALAARELDGDYVALAWSGKGVARNADVRELEPMPALFERTLPHESARYAFDAAAPDVVLVNLGTNDFVRGEPVESDVLAAYTRLLARIRAVDPRALIVAIVGPMLYDDATHRDRTLMRGWIERAVAERRAAGDDRIEMLEQWTDPAEGVGCQYHPNATTHRRLANELVAFLRPRIAH